MENEQEKKTTYTVGISGKSALLRITGRASYTNCAALGEFFLKCSKPEVIIDFKDCTTMDSTFLGIIAGASLEIKKRGSDGKLILVNLSERNLELIRNLGLHMICTVDHGKKDPLAEKTLEDLKCEESKEAASRIQILNAHETLASLNAKNAKTFQEVLTFLRQKAEDERPIE
jgi:anti-anti-sigma regulatory factor